MIYAKKDFSAFLEGVAISAIKGESIDAKLAPRAIRKLAARGLITDKKPKAQADGDEKKEV